MRTRKGAKRWWASGSPEKHERNAEMKRLREDGLTLAAIGKLYGVSRQCVWRITSRAPLPSAG